MPDDNNKVKPEEVKGTITLPSQETPFEIGKDAVENNKSTKTPEEFVRALEEAAKNDLFSPSPSPSSSPSASASPSPSPEDEEENGQ